MADLNQRFSRPSRRGVAAIGVALLTAALVATSFNALTQDQSVAMAKDIIFARKILMDAINTNMDEIETMTGSANEINLHEGREHADTISVMLMAFPHLFPASTNQWKADAVRDPGTDTFASPELWTNYADFYKQAASASKIAYNASRAKEERAYRTHIAELRQACNACHKAYQKAE
jgi:cytochrome c556